MHEDKFYDRHVPYIYDSIIKLQIVKREYLSFYTPPPTHTPKKKKKEKRKVVKQYYCLKQMCLYCVLTLLHSERPKLHRVLAILSVRGLIFVSSCFAIYMSYRQVLARPSHRLLEKAIRLGRLWKYCA